MSMLSIYDRRAILNKKLFLFDMDGTIYLGDRLFDGAIELFDAIVRRGGKYVFITNNSSKSVAEYVAKLNAMGVKADPDNFYTSAQAAADILNESFTNELIYAQGTTAFINELSGHGLNVTCDYDERAKAIVVGFDTELTGDKLFTTSKMLTKLDVPYYATNPDWVCPVEFGYIPDCGSMCFGLEKATGKKPVYIGKPQPTMIHTVLKKFGTVKSDAIVFGDRIYTDIAAGINAEVDTAFVLSGESTVGDITPDATPTYILDSIADLVDRSTDRSYRF